MGVRDGWAVGLREGAAVGEEVGKLVGLKVGEGVLGATLGAAVAVHCTVPVRIPSEQEYEPETVYPLLQVGVHKLPLARLDVHGLATPFVIAPADGAVLSFAVSQSKA